MDKGEKCTMNKTESITGFFEKDHHEIDSILEKLTFKDNASDSGIFDEFDRRLERHIKWEEDILFPAINAVNPMIEQGPIRIMKIEHESIRRSKANAKEAFKMGKLSLAQEHCDAMEATLTEHNMKEERILYPMCDESLDAAAVDQIFIKVRAS